MCAQIAILVNAPLWSLMAKGKESALKKYAALVLCEFTLLLIVSAAPAWEPQKWELPHNVDAAVDQPHLPKHYLQAG